MEVLIKSSNQEPVEAYESAKVHLQNRSLSIIQRYDLFLEGLKFSHYAVIAMAILIGSCLGSIAAMFVFYNDAPIWVFAIGLVATMANLVSCIGQAPTKWVVNLFLLSALVNIVLIVLLPIK